ncbi:cation efflux protein [Xylaria bambusicola]|uniref:cation efflux protein n=1 Tax=Xylaria bambusicola TaxID=326684 RepID=UPI002008A135|nr:cation efflux protein [Xylaria bambusicola]KAI0525872.1 cation efflux protein [Xylaria bambusicola]
MALFKLTSKQKLIAVICISFLFFVAEIAVAFYTRSLALLADAFHYLNDLIGFIIALTAILVSEKAKSPQNFSFGWARAQLLGAFFNGVFLLALGLSIFLQSIERFISIQPVDNPKLVLIIGSVGLTLNILSATLLHEHHGHDHGGHSHGQDHSHTEGHSHDHGEEHGHSHGPVNVEAASPRERSMENIALTPLSAHAEHRHTIIKLQAPGRDLGIMGVLIHVISDALNNVAVIIAALVIWLTDSPKRFYVDPGVSTAISILILLSSIPLVKNSGKILMQSAPLGVDLDDVKHDLEKIPGIESVHELHIWRLDQKKAIASAHVVVSGNDMTDFMDQAKTVKECLHAYGIHSATLQPELARSAAASVQNTRNVSSSSSVRSGQTGRSGAGSTHAAASLRRRRTDGSGCQIVCGNLCESLTCCNTAGPLRI